MAEEPTLGIITNEYRLSANAVWDAIGRGAPFNVPAHSEPDKWYGTDTPTHWFFFDNSFTSDLIRDVNKARTGDLPPLPPGVMWGENGVISAADAVEALALEHLTLISYTGSIMDEPTFVASVFSNIPLYFMNIPV